MKNLGHLIALWLLIARPWTAGAQPIPVGLPADANGNPGDTVEVAIVVADLTGRGVLSFLSAVSIDPQVLKPLGASSFGTLSDAFSPPQIETEVGRILVGATGTSPLSGQGRLINLLFEVVGEPERATPISFDFFLFNTGIPPAAISNGNFTVTEPPKPILTVSSGQLDFGTVLTNSSSQLDLTITNAGDTTLIVSDVALAGPNQNDFAITGLSHPFELAPGIQQVLHVQFSPPDPGSRRAVMRITSNDPEHPLVEVALIGEAETPPKPKISLSPTSLDFGTVGVGNLAFSQFVILNDGEAELVVSSLRLTGPDASQFAVNDIGDTLSIAPTDSQTLFVRFSPSQVGDGEADVEVSSNDPDQPVLQLGLKGAGVPPITPAITATPPALAFGLTAVDSVRHTTLNLANSGEAILRIRTITIVGVNDSQFRIDDSPPTPAQLQPGENIDLRIAFKPTQSGRAAATILVVSNDPLRPILRIPVVGEAVGPLTLKPMFVSPSDGSFSCSDSVNVTLAVEVGQAVAPVQVACAVNGIPASRQGELFTAELKLGPGRNTVRARCTASDSLGRAVSSTDSIEINVAASPSCILRIESPEPDAEVTSDSVRVQVSATTQGGTPPFEREMSINGVLANTADELFVATIVCSPGELQIKAILTVTDSCGRTATCSDSIEIACQAPPRPELLLGLAEENPSLLAIDLQSKRPGARIVGEVLLDGQAVSEMEGMAFDAANGRIFIHANSRKGRLLVVNLVDIPTLPDTGSVPARLIGATGSTHIDGLAFNPASGFLYGVDTEADILVRMDTDDGAVTEMGGIGFKNVEGLAFSGSQPPVLHGIDNHTRTLITIDTKTGRGQTVGDSTLRFSNVEALAFRLDGTLFGFSDGRASGKLLEFNLMTGSAEEVVVAGSQNFDIEGLAFVHLPQGPPDTVTDIHVFEPTIPSKFGVEQNYPNPFNPETTIIFNLPATERVQLHVFNIRGQLVSTLLDGNLQAGQHAVQWSGQDRAGQQAPSGIYIFQIRAGKFSSAKRMTLLR